MFLDTQPMDLQGLESAGSGLADFRISSPVEVHSLLKRLATANAPINLNAADGTTYTTTLWTLDLATGMLGLSADAKDPRVQRLLEADEIVAVSYLDSVKLQFDLVGAVLVHGGQSSALRAPIPPVMYRFQRRGSYRVRPLGRSAPAARFRHPAIPEMTIALRVLDVSIGGCALFLPDDIPALEPGVEINGVSIELDADTAFTITLMLHHVSSLNVGARGVRLGCSMVRLARDAEKTLQRYIDQTQKKRRLFSLD